MTIKAKILHINYSDHAGGASRVAYRIYESLKKDYSNSYMLVVDKATKDKNVIYQDRLLNKIRIRLRNIFSSRFSNIIGNKNNYKSISLLPSNINNYIKEKKIDVVHLHWVCNEMVSIEDLGKISVPIVWTIHDMWPFCGIDHYTNFDEYKFNNFFNGSFIYKILNSWTLKRKIRSWSKPMHIVGPSNWITSCAKESYLMKSWDVTRIAYPINHHYWYPENQDDSKKYFDLKTNDKVILFGAAGGINDPRKGFDLLLQSLDRLKIDNIKILIFGNARLNIQNKDYKLINIGEIKNDTILRKAYSACDIFALPSKQDNLPLTGMEAMSCGLPIIGFNSCGISDLIDHKETGWLAPAFDINNFKIGLEWLLGSECDLKILSNNSIQKSKREFNLEIISKQYSNIYRRLIKKI